MTNEIDELIIKCPSNMKALEQLYLIYKADVVALARSIVRSHESAEDALQETFLRLRRVAVRYKPQGKGKVYILKIASNIAHEIYRKNRHTETLENVDIPNPINEYVRAESTILAEQLLQGLTNEERELISLRFYSDLTLSEAAKVMNKSISTLQWRLEAIFAKLRNNGIDIEVD